MTDNRTTELLPCPFCGGEASKRLFYREKYRVHCNVCDAHSGGVYDTEAEAIAAWNTCATHYKLCTVLDVEYETKIDALLCRLTNGKWSKSRAYSLDFMVSCVDEEYETLYAKELAELGSGSTKNLMLRAFGLAQMMYDCWLEECKAGDNVDVSACNAYSYEFDQIAQAMFDIGIDPNDSDYYRSAELGSETCKLEPLSALSVTLNMLGQTEWGKCSKCGCAEPMDARFCNECGRAVER